MLLKTTETASVNQLWGAGGFRIAGWVLFNFVFGFSGVEIRPAPGFSRDYLSDSNGFNWLLVPFVKKITKNNSTAERRGSCLRRFSHETY